jgi:hypothetical protein
MVASQPGLGYIGVNMDLMGLVASVHGVPAMVGLYPIAGRAVARAILALIKLKDSSKWVT